MQHDNLQTLGTMQRLNWDVSTKTRETCAMVKPFFRADELSQFCNCVYSADAVWDILKVYLRSVRTKHVKILQSILHNYCIDPPPLYLENVFRLRWNRIWNQFWSSTLELILSRPILWNLKLLLRARSGVTIPAPLKYVTGGEDLGSRVIYYAKA